MVCFFDRTMKLNKSNKLIVLDIDNTVFDWVTYYVNSMRALY